MRHVLAALMVLAAAAELQAWDVKLEVKELWGMPGHRFVSGGVPLLAGQAREPAELRLVTTDDAGKEVAVPAQFRVLARWWRGDNSIRWVLVDFQTHLAANQARQFVLTNRVELKPGDPPGKLAVEQNDDQIAIATGPARFVIGRKQFCFLDKAILDANGDGKFDDDENLLADSTQAGAVIEDTYGQRYPGSAGAKSVEVIESGPMRVCVRARGVHKAPEGKGYSRGMYQYDVFMNFYAGSTDVYCDVVLGNNFTKSIGEPTFEDASLVFRLAGNAPAYQLVGDKPVEGKLAANESVTLYQDSNGADTWETCQGYDDNEKSGGWQFPKGLTASFRGFRVTAGKIASLYARADDREIARGDHARGLLNAWTDRGGVIVHTKNFWQQFPKAVSVGGNGWVRVGLFPGEYKVPHFLEDGTAKGHEIVLHFYAPGGKPDASAWADAWDSRAYPRPELAHQAACGALTDLGPFTVPTRGLDSRPDSRVAIDSKRMFDDLDAAEGRLYGNAYGWQIFGERWRSQGGHGNRGARQPMDQDDYLRRWYATGSREWLAVGEARSRQFRDVRGYRVEDTDAFGYKDWLTFRAANISEDRLDRPKPSDQEYQKYTQGKWKRAGLWLPNPEHMVLDLLYDRYCLFGDVRAFENMPVVAANGAYYAIDHKPEVTRSQGWGWRALDRYWELTGDPKARQMLTRVMATYKPMVGNAPLICGSVEKPNWWFTTIFGRAIAMAALHTGDPDVLDLCKTMAADKAGNARTVSTLFAVLYHLTGDESYKKAVFAKDDGSDALSIGGYLFICDHWLLNQPPKRK